MPRRLLAAVATILLVAACGGTADSDPITAGRTIYGDRCSSCHGSSGGGGIGPDLHTVLTTWPACAAHIEWVTIGSDGWTAAHGDTYGATNKPVTGGMPAHGTLLQPVEIAQVAAFERVQFGDGGRDAVLADCGLPPTP